MAKDTIKGPKDIPYDIFEDKKWLFFIIGFAPIRNVFYILYIFALFFLQLYIEAMAVYASYLVSPNKSLIFDALHVITASLFAVWGLSCRIISERHLMKIMETIKAGIYLYTDEELDDEQVKMKQAITGEIRKKSNAITFMYIIGFTSNVLFFPLSQLLVIDEKTKTRPDYINSYLPHVFFTPFNTQTTLGFSTIYVMDFCFILFVYATAVSLNGIYITCTVMMKVHLQLLGDSIRKIERRAYMLYSKHNTVNPIFSQKDLINSREFQNCLNACLKANVKHHQALLRFRKDCQSFVGSVLLDIFVLAAIIYASTLYLLYQKPPLNIFANYLFTNLAEQTYTFFICIFGEEVIAESSNLFKTLYDIEWFHYDERFKQTLGIMMANTRRPIHFKAMLLDITASVETYGNILSGMYKIMSVARQSDALN